MDRSMAARLLEIEKARRVLLARLDAELARVAPDHAQNLALYEGLYEEALALGSLPPHDPLEGIEVDIALARALRVHGQALERPLVERFDGLLE